MNNQDKCEHIRLTRYQTQAIGLISIGTFLEYFDLMLYVHMSVVLNQIFFPTKIDHTTSVLLTAFSFCSTYIFRPFGALLFGWIGDSIGRKATIVLTTMLMSITCVIVATLPSYSEIGIFASVIITICRIVQGISSMGEKIGTEIYITELMKPPIQYPAVALISCFSNLGAIVALAIATFVMTYAFNWRIAFWIGAIIALVGSAARGALRETIDFIDAKRKLINAVVEQGIPTTNIINELKKNFLSKIKINNKTIIALFLIYCTWPVWFYLTYIYCADILRNFFNFTAEQIINQNFYVALVQLFGNVTLMLLCYKINPLTILKLKAYIFLPIIIIWPYLLSKVASPLDVFLLQALIICGPSCTPGMAIFLKHFPSLRRFTITSLSYAISRAVMYVITSIGLVYCTQYLGLWSISIITIPVILGYIYGISHFITLNKIKGKAF